MSNYPVRHPVDTQRARRLGYFCREIHRLMLSLCLDQNVSTRYVKDFMDEFLHSLEEHDVEYPIEALVEMLAEPRLVEHTFARYKEALT